MLRGECFIVRCTFYQLIRMQGMDLCATIFYSGGLHGEHFLRMPVSI